MKKRNIKHSECLMMHLLFVHYSLACIWFGFGGLLNLFIYSVFFKLGVISSPLNNGNGAVLSTKASMYPHDYNKSFLRNFRLILCKLSSSFSVLNNLPTRVPIPNDVLFAAEVSPVHCWCCRKLQWWGRIVPFGGSFLSLPDTGAVKKVSLAVDVASLWSEL